MSKIIASPEVLKYVENSKPGDKTIYFNKEALKMLPEEFEAHISKVTFTKKDFYDLKTGDNKYMPIPSLAYAIAEARGIHGTDYSNSGSLYETVDISEREMTGTPQYVKIMVGYYSEKTAAVRIEDGSEYENSPCRVEYNCWNRCSKEWANEEEITEGYTKVKEGKYIEFEYGKNVEKFGRYYETKFKDKMNAHSLKYDTKFKRRLHFKKEMILALNITQTKAYGKAIRELACLLTAYDEETVNRGYFYFAKIVRSSESLKLETAARLAGMSKSLDGVLDDQKLLYGSDDSEEMKTVNGDSGYIHDEDYPEETKAQQMKRILQEYIESKFEIQELEKVTALINWLSGDIQESGKMWESAVKRFKAVEECVPEEFRIDHSIY